MPLISDPPTNRKKTHPPNIKKYGFTPTTNGKIKKMVFPFSQVDLNGTALSWMNEDDEKYSIGSNSEKNR